MLDPRVAGLINNAVTRAPDWLRQDLLSKDAKTRQTAEETLAAMISSALESDEAA